MQSSRSSLQCMHTDSAPFKQSRHGQAFRCQCHQSHRSSQSHRRHEQSPRVVPRQRPPGYKSVENKNKSAWWIFHQKDPKQPKRAESNCAPVSAAFQTRKDASEKPPTQRKIHKHLKPTGQEEQGKKKLTRSTISCAILSPTSTLKSASPRLNNKTFTGPL